MSKIVVSPVTRVEGHLGIEAEVQDGEVVDAYVKGKLFRGFEKLLQGRDPRDAQHITQRICGVCPVSHGLAASHALEEAFGVVPPENARIIRNLVLGANLIQSHILHFYHLASLDYVKGPPRPPFIPRYVQDHRLPDHQNDALVEHYLDALKMRMKAQEMGAIFGGKMPHVPSFVPGGVTVNPTQAKINSFRKYLQELQSFIDEVYLPDVNIVAREYGRRGEGDDYGLIGRGHGNLLAYGGFDLGNGETWLKGGRIVDGGEEVFPIDKAKITEDVHFSWYEDATSGLHPSDGLTEPEYDKVGAYSWVKAPRYDGLPHEVGPLARMWVNGYYVPEKSASAYAQGLSVIDRNFARAVECSHVAREMDVWLDELQPGEDVWTECEVPNEGEGCGMVEAPRGALGHWIRIKDGTIANYQCVVPTTWNAAPRNDEGVRGPIEEALIDTPVADPDNPIELLRVVRSFDPCIACSIHLIKPDGEMEPFRVV